jgi:nucleoside-diphosphate-sugar epimerase
MPLAIAVTGATGFAGRHVVDELLKRGHRVTALVRRPGHAGLPAEIRLVGGDLSDAGALAGLVAGADAVIHLAGAITGLRPADYHLVNREGALAVARAARGAGVSRFIHVSSLSAREPSVSHYGASKAAGEVAVRDAFGPAGLLTVRPPAIYGPGDRATLPLFRSLTGRLALVPSTVQARFSLVFVADVARMLAAAVGDQREGIAEISDGKPGGYSWGELARVAATELGRPIQVIYLPRAVVDTVALAAETAGRLAGRPGMVNRDKVAELYHHDWVCGGPAALPDALGFAEGFAATLAWYREAGWLPRPRRADRTSATTRNET